VGQDADQRGSEQGLQVSITSFGFKYGTPRDADLVLDVPAEVTGWLDRVFHLLPITWSAIRRPDVSLPWDLLVGLFVLPGLVAMLLLWALVRLIFRRAGVGGVLRRLKTRPPDPDDLAERRVFPAIDLLASGTRKEELLLSEAGLAASRVLRQRIARFFGLGGG